MTVASLSVIGEEELIKETTSRCPVCRKPKPAQVLRVTRDGKQQVVMRRSCPCHGTHDFVIASDARFYWKSIGSRASGCGCGGACESVGEGGKPGLLGKNATDGSVTGVMEKLSTCLALIEIVDSCNLKCPTCFANSQPGKSGQLKYYDLKNITDRIQGVIDRKGKIEILQLSGGEPTIHPQFFEIVEWVRNNPQIEYLLINTNGVRFAKDEPFVRKMGELWSKYRNMQLYLQFDGPQEEGQKELRGVDLRRVRDTAIENCARIGLPITLAMTVTKNNLSHLWHTVQYGLQFKNVRGVSFQPMFISGRVNGQVNGRVQLGGIAKEQPITMADLILGLNDQSEGQFKLDDVTPLPCGDPNCAATGWIIRKDGKLFSPSDFGINLAELQSKVPDRVNYNLSDLAKCGCEGTELGALMKMLEHHGPVDESVAFRLFFKPFMDERTWDDDRIDRCCTHVITPEGKLDSFCRYYLGPTNDATCKC